MQRRPSSLYREPLALLELGQLLGDPVYYGDGVPKGDGRGVLVLPGLFGNDLYLYPLHVWLRRIGYRPLRSGLAINAGCPERLSRQVEEELRRRLRPGGGQLALIGHSRGGMLARAIAGRLQDEVSHLVLLGSPVGALMGPWQSGPSRGSKAAPAASIVVEAGTRARRFLDPDCDAPDCGCPFPEDLRRPLSAGTRVVSIYSRDDPIVAPWACQIPGAVNVDVRGTHSGLAYNPAVYRALGAALADFPP